MNRREFGFFCIGSGAAFGISGVAVLLSAAYAPWLLVW